MRFLIFITIMVTELLVAETPKEEKLPEAKAAPTNADATTNEANDNGTQPFVPNKELFVQGIINIYEKSLVKEPDNLDLRRRFIEFLREQNKTEKMLTQMQELARLTPDDAELQNQINNLTSLKKEEKPETTAP